MKNKNTIEVLNKIEVNDIIINTGDEVYYSRIIPQVGVCYVQTLKVRTIYEDSLVGIDSVTKNAQLINNSSIGITLFTKRKDANKVIEEAKKSGKIRKFNEKEKDEE